MNRFKPILFVLVLALIGGAAGVLAHAKSNQRLGAPGVKTGPLAGSYNLEVLLPSDVPGFQSVAVPISEVVTNMLPFDTSFGQRRYRADDGFYTLVNVVLMGSSRASIHKPQVCLTAQGWTINDELSHEDRVHLDRPGCGAPGGRLGGVAERLWRHAIFSSHGAGQSHAVGGGDRAR